MVDKKRRGAESLLEYEIIQFIRRELVIVLKNPYEDFNDIVEYVAIVNGGELLDNLGQYRHLFIMTDESIEKKIGAATKYIWYGKMWTETFMACLILKDILKHNGDNLRIKTKIKQYYVEAVERLRVDNKILENVKVGDIVRMSNTSN